MRTKMERDILVEVNHPFIVKLHYGELLTSHHQSDSYASWLCASVELTVQLLITNYI